MKRHTKVLLIISGVSAAAGLGLTVSGAALGATLKETGIAGTLSSVWKNWGTISLGSRDFSWDDDEEAGFSQVDATESVDSEENGIVYEIPVQADMELSVRIAYETLLMEPGDGKTIRVEVREDDDISVKQDGKKIHINSTEKSRKHKKGGVTVYYPENTEFASVDIEVGAGEGSISGTLMAKEFDVEVGVGSLSDSGEVKAEECSFNVGVGELKLSRVAASEIVGECGVGSLEMTLVGSWEDYNYELECAMGDLDVGNDSYSGFAAEKSIDNGADKKVDIACGIGDVKVDFSE